MKNKEKNTEKNAPLSKNAKRTLIIVTASVLALALVGILLASILGNTSQKVKSPVLKYEKTMLPLSFYNLMLTRTKANLARSGYDVTSMDFWNAESVVAGKTNKEYYTEKTLDTCKLYLLSAYLFDKEGLTLPDSYYATIDEEINDCIEIGYIGGGSKEKFDEILSNYGFNSDEYRDALIIKGKAEYLQEYIFGTDGSKIGEELKNEYYNKYYYRFKQILVANYYYTYELDDYGCEVYFMSDMSKPLYDTENGVVGFGEDKDYLRDKYGEKIYFEADSDGNPMLDKPLYDKENGVRQPICDDSGNPIKNPYTEEEMKERYTTAQAIAARVGVGNFAAFEAEMSKLNDAASGAAQNPDGYYLTDISGDGYYGYDYLNKILSSLKSMSVGENAIVESSEGYHIVMRYSLDSGAYSDSDKSAWFENFIPTIMTEVFREKYKDILNNIEVIEENLKLAEPITIAGINYDYWK